MKAMIMENDYTPDDGCLLIVFDGEVIGWLNPDNTIEFPGYTLTVDEVRSVIDAVEEYVKSRS